MSSLENGKFSTGSTIWIHKISMFFCLWDSRAKDQHYVKKDWSLRTELKPGDDNVMANPLVPRDKIIFPPLHIKLGLMKQFVKELDNEEKCFTCVTLFQALV